MAHPDTERARGVSDRGVPKRPPQPRDRGGGGQGHILTTRGWHYPNWHGAKGIDIPHQRGEPKPFPREEAPPPLPTLPPMPGQEGPGEDIATPPRPVPYTAKKRQARGARRRRGRGRAAGPAPSPPPATPEPQQPAERRPIVLPSMDIYMGEALEQRRRERLLRQAFITNPLRAWAALKELAPKEEHRRRPEWELDERDPMDIYRRRMIGYTADQIRRDRAITDESRGTKVPPKKPKVMTRLDKAKMQIKKGFLRGIGRLLPDPGPDWSTSPGVGGGAAGGGQRM
jgi:hypothetical protein